MILIDLLEKIQAGAKLDEQDIMLTETPLYKLFGYETVDDCVRAVKNRLHTKSSDFPKF